MMDYDKYVNMIDRQRFPTEWRAEEKRLVALFRTDLLADFELTGHPKADQFFTLAWQEGHASGYQGVWNEANEMACLMLRPDDDTREAARRIREGYPSEGDEQTLAMWIEDL